MPKKPSAPRKVNTDWFTKRIEDKGTSLRQIAKAMGLDPSAVSLMLRGKRDISTAEAVELARLLGVPFAEVLSHAGIKVPGGAASTSRTVPVVGTMSGDGEADITWKGGEDSVAAPPELPANCVAVQMRSPTNPRDGEIFFTSPPGDGVPADAIGRRCLVRLTSGETLLRYLRRGYKAGRYNLLTEAGNTATDAALEWATPVYWIKCPG